MVMTPNNDFPVHLYMLYTYLVKRIVSLFYAKCSIGCVILQKHLTLEGLKKKNIYLKKKSRGQLFHIKADTTHLTGM